MNDPYRRLIEDRIADLMMYRRWYGAHRHLTAPAEPRASVEAVPDFEWRADAVDGDRHAFPQRHDVGLPPPAMCGIRWTVRFGEHGARYCPFCLDRLKAILSGVATALEEAEAGE